VNRDSHFPRPDGQSREKFANLAAVASITPMAMGTALDVLNAPQSLTARRQAASHLPAFELPPPPLSQFAANVAQKYSSYPSSNPPQQGTSAVSVGNLLTPPSNSNSDSTSPAGGITQNNNQNPTGILPYTPSSYWPSGTGTTPYNTGFTPTWQGSNAFFQTRGMFSPSLGSLVRNSNNSPSAGEGQSLPPPPPFDLNVLPPFQSSMSMSAPPNSAVALQQQQQQQQAMSNAIMSSQNGMPTTSQSPPIHSSEPMSQKSASTPALYGGSQPSSTPQQATFPYGGPSPMQQSPHPVSAPPTSRISPPMGQSPVNNTPSQAHFVRPPYPSYSLPAMQGAIMTNVHSPGGQMSMVGNMQQGMMPQFNSGYAANAQNMYNNQQHQTQHQPVPNDRPFKCDQCPQSFNRNHDLKRHKRIHLAVKPFPCSHCDKSFSRKDALKVCA
jgi:Zinc finger, C2H2 type